VSIFSINSDGICDYNIMFFQPLLFNDFCFPHCKRLISAHVGKEGDKNSFRPFCMYRSMDVFVQPTVGWYELLLSH